MPPQRIRMVVPSRLDQIPVVGRLLDGAARNAGLDERAAHEFRLAVGEVVANAIEHGYRMDPGHDVEVRLDADDDELAVEVWDSGTSLDPARLARPLAPPVEAFDPESLPDDGLDLPFVREVMDAVEYTSRGGRNCMRLVRRLQGEKKDPR